MKKVLLATCLAGLFTSQAHAIALIDVTQVDTLLASAHVNSGDAAEEAWVEEVLNVDVTLEYKTADMAGAWEAVDEIGSAYAYALQSPVEYFVIKTGNLHDGDMINHFLYQNVANFDYAVVDLEGILDEVYGVGAWGDTELSNINLGKISHVDEFSGGITTTPIPAAAWLFGTALAGIAGLRARRRKTKTA